MIISSNVETYTRGGRQIPYANQTVEGTGIAVYFRWNGDQHVIACDRWKSLDGNVRAIDLTVAALRGLERWGATDIRYPEATIQSFSGLKALPEQGSGRPSWVVLEVDHNASFEDVKTAYRRRARETHPVVDALAGGAQRLSARQGTHWGRHVMFVVADEGVSALQR